MERGVGRSLDVAPSCVAEALRESRMPRPRHAATTRKDDREMESGLRWTLGIFVVLAIVSALVKIFMPH